MHYMGIDHHKQYSHITVLDERGEVIKAERVGNTSNSDFPHLHFHLMDSPDFNTANGLPVRFKNIPDAQPAQWDYENASTFLYSDYIFLNIAD